MSILALGAVNYVGIKSGNRLQATLTVLKIAALAALPIVALALHPVTPSFTPVRAADRQPGGRLRRGDDRRDVGLRGLVITCRSAPAKSRTPAAPCRSRFVIGIVALVVIYLTVNLSYMLALPLGEIQGVERIAEKAVTALDRRRAARRIVAATVVVSTLGCNAAAVIGMSRTCYAMASDGLFFKAAAAVHPRYRTPHVAIAITCAWAALLTLTGTYEQLFTWVTFASVAFGVLGGLGDLPAAAAEAGRAPAAHRTWGYPVVPALFVAGLGVLRRQHRRRKTGGVAHRRVSGRARPAGVTPIGGRARSRTRADVNGRWPLPETSPDLPASRRPPRKFTAGAARSAGTPLERP